MATDMKRKDLIINRLTQAQYDEIEPKEDELYVITDASPSGIKIDNDTIKWNTANELYASTYSGGNPVAKQQQSGIVPDIISDNYKNTSLKGDGLWGYPQKVDCSVDLIKIDTGKPEELNYDRLENLMFNNVQYALDLISRSFLLNNDLTVGIVNSPTDMISDFVVPAMHQGNGTLQLCHWNMGAENINMYHDSNKPMITVLKDGKIKLSKIKFQVTADKECPDVLFTNDGNLYLEDCTFTLNPNAHLPKYVIKNTGHLELKNCQFMMSSDKNEECISVIENIGGSVTINNVEITINTGCTCPTNIVHNDNGTITANTFKAKILTNDTKTSKNFIKNDYGKIILDKFTADYQTYIIDSELDYLDAIIYSNNGYVECQNFTCNYRNMSVLGTVYYGDNSVFKLSGSNNIYFTSMQPVEGWSATINEIIRIINGSRCYTTNDFFLKITGMIQREEHMARVWTGAVLNNSVLTIANQFIILADQKAVESCLLNVGSTLYFPENTKEHLIEGSTEFSYSKDKSSVFYDKNGIVN